MDDTLLSAAVWRATDQWQVEDDPVELRMRVHGKLSGYLLGSATGLVLFAVLWCAVLGGIAAPVALGLVAVAAVALAGWLRVIVGRAKAVLADGVSRRVAAVVVAHRGMSAVVAAEGRYLRVRPITWPRWQVIARTGEITVVGPDAKGNAVVFVDSQPTPLPAKVVAAPEQVGAEPIARVSWQGAEDDVPMAYARQQARRLWLQVAAVLVVVAGFAIDAVRDESAFPTNGSFAALLALSMVFFPVSVSAQLRLPRLLAAGQWKQYQAVVLGWRSEGERQGTADLSVQLSRTDGELRRMVVKAAPVEVVAHVNATGTLWVIEPAGGRFTAVGVPGYPVAAPAKFV
ncbi:hypothetical protein [Kutzneria sp. CA-103260]|uniref:hypothetical protein n=1 Tax=Kutzneria sp. CA-103260 TaxID=2802641 RepID=UPI001BA732EA|nr:hypothetical protein [Kutzneria sp. CA-103260]QUQ69872.1 hypothetical protein JJ691_76390 [Kutzneria sp. CA-103260]